jgi:hypothetical protein
MGYHFSDNYDINLPISWPIYRNAQINVFTGTDDDNVFTGTDDDNVFTGTDEDNVLTGTNEDNVFTGTDEDNVFTGTDEDNVFTGTNEDNVFTLVWNLCHILRSGKMVHDLGQYRFNDISVSNM